MSAKLHEFLKELQRRRVLRVAAVYIAAVWVIAAGGADLFTAFGVPDWGLRMFVLLAVFCLPVVLALTWMFQVTRSGVVRDRGLESQPTTVADLGLDSAAPPLEVSWTDPGMEKRTGRFRSSFRIGREPACEIRLGERAVSRAHAEIYPDGQVWWIRDLGSTNGTYVNDERVDALALPRHAVVRCAKDGQQIVMETLGSPEATQIMPAVQD